MKNLSLISIIFFALFHFESYSSDSINPAQHDSNRSHSFDPPLNDVIIQDTNLNLYLDLSDIGEL